MESGVGEFGALELPDGGGQKDRDEYKRGNEWPGHLKGFPANRMVDGREESSRRDLSGGLPLTRQNDSRVKRDPGTCIVDLTQSIARAARSLDSNTPEISNRNCLS